MLIKKIGPFQSTDYKDFWAIEGERGSYCNFNLCRTALASWFDADEDKPLWVQIHDCPGKDRLEVVGLRAGGCGLEVITKQGKTEYPAMCPGWTRMLKIPYPYYAEIVQ